MFFLLFSFCREGWVLLFRYLNLFFVVPFPPVFAKPFLYRMGARVFLFFRFSCLSVFSLVPIFLYFMVFLFCLLVFVVRI